VVILDFCCFAVLDITSFFGTLFRIKKSLLSWMFIASDTCWLAYRPHPNECSGGDLDGDLFFISWDNDLIPCQTEAPMDYTGRRPRIMDHKVTLEVNFIKVIIIFFLEKYTDECRTASSFVIS